MPFVPVPNTAEVSMQALWDNQEVANVFHVTQSTPYDATSLAVLGALFQDWIDTSLKTNVSNSVQYTKLVMRSLESEGAPAIEYTTNFPISGVHTGTAQLPNNVTVAVKWSTGLAGRSYRGRTYHIGLAEAFVTGNVLESSFATALLGIYNDLLEAFDTYPGDLTVVSKFHNNAARTTGIATPIISCSINPVVDSQRRRLPGRGR